MDRVLDISKALADRTRLRIVMALECGPLCLHQVTEVLNLAPSTVSKHLQILVSSGLLVTWQEGRWHYFAWAHRDSRHPVTAIHRWLKETLSGDPVVGEDLAKRAIAMQSCPLPTRAMSKPRVLLLCTGNSCRSQMAEALLRKHGGDMYEVHSAGLNPKPIAPLTFTVMNEIGIELSGQHPKGVMEYLGRMHFGYLITVCANAEERCPVFPGVVNRLCWPMDDPAAVNGSRARKLAAFREVRDTLEKRICEWLGQERAHQADGTHSQDHKHDRPESGTAELSHVPNKDLSNNP